MWNEARTDLAAKLWREGVSARDIAERVGGGMTKNSVIGKAHRKRWLKRGVAHHSRGGSTKSRYDRNAVLDRWLAGQNEGQIGRILGYPPGRVSGIVNEARNRGDPRAVRHGRVKWESRDHTWLQHRSTKPNAYKSKPPRVPIEDLVKPVEFNLPLMELTVGMCRWPSGNGPYTFCGLAKFEGKSYCEYHCRLAYQPLQQRSERDLQKAANFFARAA